MMSGIRVRSFALWIVMVLAACGPADDRERLVIYSPHGPDMLRAFEEQFESLHPEIDLQWIDMGSQEVLDRVRSERANPQADVWWGAPSQLFHAAARDGLLARFRPTWADEVGEYADPGDRFFATYLTPEVIAYNTEAVPLESAPRDWDDVLHPQWDGKVLIRDPIASGTMRTIFGMIIQRSIRETGSPDAGFEWLRQLDGQTREYVLNPTMLYQKLARREGVVTLWDLPDIEMLRDRTGYPIDYTIPTSGTPVVIDAVAQIAGGPNPEAAKAFIEFIGGREAVTRAAREFYRLPARGDIAVSELPDRLRSALEQLNEEPMDWEMLEEHGAAWMRRWDETVRGRG